MKIFVSPPYSNLFETILASYCFRQPYCKDKTSFDNTDKKERHFLSFHTRDVSGFVRLFYILSKNKKQKEVKQTVFQ